MTEQDAAHGEVEQHLAGLEEPLVVFGSRRSVVNKPTRYWPSPMIWAATAAG
jgi:hypothetical protein